MGKISEPKSCFKCGGKPYHWHRKFPGKHTLEHHDQVMCENYKIDNRGNISGCDNIIFKINTDIYGNYGQAINTWNSQT